MLKKQILTLFFLLYTYQSSGFLDTPFELAKYLWKLSGAFGAIKTNVDGTKSLADGFSLWGEPENAEILGEISKLSTQLNNIEHTMAKRFDAIEFLLKQLPVKLSIDADRKKLRECIEHIEIQRSIIRKHVKRGRNTSLQTWRTIASTAVIEVSRSIDSIRILLAPIAAYKGLDAGLIMTIANRTAGLGDKMCIDTQLVHHFVANLVELAMMMEMQAMEVFTITYPFHYPDDWRQEIEDAQANSEERYLMYLNTSLEAMSITPENLWVCDPDDGAWVRDKSYIEIEKLQQRIFFNVPYKEFQRKEECEEQTSQKLKPLYSSKVNESDRCDGGYLTQCHDQHFDLICRLENNVKRYDWWKMGGTPGCNFLGKDKCSCICHHDQNNMISLALTETETDKNMVVTGAQLVRQDRTLYIKLKQGKLLPNGQIDPRSQSWLPLPTTVSRKRYITSGDKRFFLSNPILPYGYALTGVRFLNHPEATLELIGQRFHYSNGTLLPDRIPIRPDQESTSNPSERYPELKFPNKNSIYTTAFHTPDSGDQWIELQRSSMELDVEQSVLPLFDSQPVETNPPSPLSGIGLFHKGVKDYAGFIALQLHSLQYKSRIEEMIQNHKAGTIFGER